MVLDYSVSSQLDALKRENKRLSMALKRAEARAAQHEKLTFFVKVASVTFQQTARSFRAPEKVVVVTLAGLILFSDAERDDDVLTRITMGELARRVGNISRLPGIINRLFALSLFRLRKEDDLTFWLGLPSDFLDRLQRIPDDMKHTIGGGVDCPRCGRHSVPVSDDLIHRQSRCKCGYVFSERYLQSTFDPLTEESAIADLSGLDDFLSQLAGRVGSDQLLAAIQRLEVA